MARAEIHRLRPGPSAGARHQDRQAAAGRSCRPHDLDKIRRMAAARYLAGHPADDPVVSPLTADLAGLPSMLVQAATGDPLLDEATGLVDRAGDYGWMSG